MKYMNDIIKMTGITALAILVLIVLWGCGGSSASTAGGQPNPDTGYCAPGMVSNQVHHGDVEAARVMFNDLIKNPKIKPVMTPEEVLNVIGIAPKKAVKHWAFQAKRFIDSGYEAGIKLHTIYEHWIYIEAMYPTDPEKKYWHLECIETRRDNFGKRISFDIEPAVDHGVDIERVVSGDYGGIEVAEFFLMKY